MIQRFDTGTRMSEMAVHNGIAYLAGQVATDTTQGIEGQTQQILKAIDALLDRAGSRKTCLLMVQIFLPNLDDFDGMNRVWEEWIPAGHSPARATVQAKLMRPDWKIEVVATAAVDP